MTPHRLHLTLAILAFAAATATAARPAVDAAGMCQHTTYPKLCQEVAQTVPAATPQTLTHALLQTTANKLTATKAAVDQLVAASSTDATVKKCLTDCQQQYDLFTDDIQSSLTQVTSGKYIGLRETLSALISYAGSCQDGFSDFPGTVNPVAHQMDNLMKHTTNSLDMATDALKC